MLVESGLQHALTVHGKNLAVQGELMGPGIQKNREGLKEFTLFVFDFYDIDQGKYLTPYERHNLIMVLDALAQQVGKGISHVPLVQVSKLSEVADGLSSLLTFAEGPSLNHPVREGVVFKRLDGQFSFKVISNAFLLKEKE
jgi:ATP-dependent RNA circularization protein (DNA/RNA ligase family)